MLVREDLAFALAVILLGLLMMITRRNAVTQIVGFMSLENGLVLAATGAKGMPLVVEFSVAFSILIAFIVFGVFVFRIRERFDTVDVERARPLPRRTEGTLDDLPASMRCCSIPAIAVPMLALVSNYRLGAALNVLASGASLAAGVALLFVRTDAQRSAHRRRFQHLSRHADHVRRLHHQHLQRELHRPRDRNRPAHAGVPALLSRASTRR